ncbi:unnamed protein product [Closterium sp. Yama58-4]|nr:unnamed protein product [Closterium sp. Yama58-4]
MASDGMVVGSGAAAGRGEGDSLTAATTALTFHDFLERMKQPAAADLVRPIRNFMMAFMSKEPEPERDSASVQAFLPQHRGRLPRPPPLAGRLARRTRSKGEGAIGEAPEWTREAPHPPLRPPPPHPPLRPPPPHPPLRPPPPHPPLRPPPPHPPLRAPPPHPPLRPPPPHPPLRPPPPHPRGGGERPAGASFPLNQRPLRPFPFSPPSPSITGPGDVSDDDALPAGFCLEEAEEEVGGRDHRMPPPRFISGPLLFLPVPPFHSPSQALEKFLTTKLLPRACLLRKEEEERGLLQLFPRAFAPEEEEVEEVERDRLLPLPPVSAPLHSSRSLPPPHQQQALEKYLMTELFPRAFAPEEEEALEKYLMTKLFPRAFAPEEEEVERDRRLTTRIAALQTFLQPRHLDVPDSLLNDASLLLAEKDLQKLGSFKAPRDKLVCVLNCCRVINNILLNASMTAAAAAAAGAGAGEGGGKGGGKPPGADDFLPVLIYVVVKANPPQLLSSILYIQRYRHSDRLVSEAAYFFTNLASAATFLESLSAAQLSLSDQEFQRLLEAGPSSGAAGSSSSSNPQREREAERVVAVSEISRDKGVLRELVRADASGELARSFRFLYASAADLSIADVSDLLAEYKDLALRHYALSRVVHGAGISLPLSFPSNPARPTTTGAGVSGASGAAGDAEGGSGSREGAGE